MRVSFERSRRSWAGIAAKGLQAQPSAVQAENKKATMPGKRRSKDG